VHEPNPDVPVEETLGAIEDLVDAGKVRFVGVSNFTVQQLQQAQRVMRRHAIVSNQVRYNIVDRTIETGLLAYCQSQGMTVIAYSPLGRELQRVMDCDPSGVLQAVATETGKTIPQVVLNWCLSRDGVVAIPKGNTVAHVLENCGASGWRLSEAQLSRLNEAIRFRHRSAGELALRRLIPSSAVSTVKRIVKVLPPSLRRRLE
jgi:diketogulonate reductase-like aldo/keto reductase